MTGERAPRVVFVCPNLEAGGAERQWASLVPGLHEQGFDVSVVTLDCLGLLLDQGPRARRSYRMREACALR